MIQYLSERGKRWVRNVPPVVKIHFDNFYNFYDAQTNPNGLINMGTAESHLINDEICDLLGKIAVRVPLSGYDLHYNRYEGSDEFRTAIANHWQKVIFGSDSDVMLTKDNCATCTGCTVALETLATLLADPGDVFLIPAPYYSGFISDIGERPGVVPVGVQMKTLDRNVFEQAYEQQKKLGRRVRAVLFSSPNNPTGIVYKPEEVQELIEFAMAHDLEIISDEIYAQTVFAPATEFISTLKLVPQEYRHRVHVTSSFAKDYTLSGFKAGICISFNPSIIQAFASTSTYSCVSTHTQAVLTGLLMAPELEHLLALSTQRLAQSFAALEQGCKELGITITPAQAGFFVLADLAAFLPESTFEAENILWEKLCREYKINISPGQYFGTDRPGWFRICYPFEPATVQELCRRLGKLEKT